MGRWSRYGVAALCTGGLVAAGWALLGDGDAADSKILINRIWVDRLPAKDTDHFELLVLVDDEPVGLFRRASQFEGNYALFRYELRGDDKLQMLFPQDKSKHEVRYKARACDVKDYDYCLDVEGAPRGVKRYVSRKEWEIGGGSQGQLQARVAAWAASAIDD